jgi:hypothetical protein
MAHLQPPSTGRNLPPSNSLHYWPTLFEQFGVPWPRRLFDYSMDEARLLPQIPAYFNLGFVALNPAGIAAFVPRIFDFPRAFKSAIDSYMRCQVVLALIAYQQGLDIDVLPAAYNAANDPGHMRHNNLSVEDIRVLDYLRTDEIDRSLIFQEDHIEAFLAAELVNPANRALQALAREYRRGSIQGRTRRWPAGMRNSWMPRRWRRSG